MALVSLIAAMDRNRLIGSRGALPWRLPDDYRHFRRITMGKAVVMGRRTWESLDGPLAGRENVVVSRNPDYQAPGASVALSLAAALERLRDREEIVIAGGTRLYAEALPLADRLYLTFVDTELEGDTWFPRFDLAGWREVERREHEADDRHAHPFCMVTFERES